MKPNRLIGFLTFLGLICSLHGPAQELFRLDFEEVFLPEEWIDTEKSEWGHQLGQDQGSYFRFHPFSWRDFLQSPMLDLDAGSYTLYYSWNETGSGNPNFINIRIREDEGFWNILHQFGSGNQRTWLRDSLVIGELGAGTYQLEFEYKSLGKFPSQYMNLDNIYLVRRDIVTALQDDLLEIKFDLFPNPVADQLNYRLADEEGRSFEFQITNQLGQIVVDLWTSSGGGQLDISHLEAGNYDLEIRHGDKALIKRFVVVR